VDGKIQHMDYLEPCCELLRINYRQASAQRLWLSVSADVFKHKSGTCKHIQVDPIPNLHIKVIAGQPTVV